MLHIYYGDLETSNYIYNPDSFFNNTYEDDWIVEDLSIRMIKEIDGSDVKGSRLIDSPFLGPIPTERLSGGVKTLILMQHDSDHIFNASACGENCAPWILKIAQNKELIIRLGYIMHFGDGPYEIQIDNTGKVVHNDTELITEIIEKDLLA